MNITIGALDTRIATVVVFAPQIAGARRGSSSSFGDVRSSRDWHSPSNVNLHMSTSKSATNLRAALKTAGYSARQVTIRQRHSTLDVTIREAGVSHTKVSAIASAFESVRRCEASGEILLGGNTFVRVEYAETLVDPIKATIAALLAPAPMDEFVALPGGFRAEKVSPARRAHALDEVQIEGPGFDFRNDRAFGVTWAAERIAVAYLDATAQGQGAAS